MKVKKLQYLGLVINQGSKLQQFANHSRRGNLQEKERGEEGGYLGLTI